MTFLNAGITWDTSLYVLVYWHGPCVCDLHFPQKNATGHEVDHSLPSSGTAVLHSNALYLIKESQLHAYAALRVYTYSFSLINPTRYTVLFNIFIYFSSLHVSGIRASFIRRKLLYLCDIVICQSIWVVSGLLVGFSLQPADQTPPIQSDNCQCRIDTVIFSWWCAHGRPKHVQKINKYINQNCPPSWIYLRDEFNNCPAPQ